MEKEKLITLLLVLATVAVLLVLGPSILKIAKSIIGISESATGKPADSGVGSSTYSAIPKGEKVEYIHILVTQPGITVDKDYFAKNIPSSVRRQGIIDRIVLHHTATNNALEAIRTFQSMKDRSSHYVIDRDGTIYYLIDESRKAWHAGCCPDTNKKCCDAKTCPICMDSSWTTINDRSIGIEIVNTGEANDAYPEAQYEAILKLINDISARHHFSLDAQHVIAHYQITKDKCDPSKGFDWSQVELKDHITAEQLGKKC